MHTAINLANLATDLVWLMISDMSSSTVFFVKSSIVEGVGVAGVPFPPGETKSRTVHCTPGDQEV